MGRINRNRSGSGVALAMFGLATLVLVLSPAASAAADTTIDGPIDLGTAAPFSVLGSSTVTNTGPSVVWGDVGVYAGSAIDGFPPGTHGGVQHAADATALSAQNDLTTAYGVASGLTPTTSGLGDLVGLSLIPGVYSGDTLSLSGTLTLTGGDADSVWVFQAASTLITSSGSTIVVNGPATACNVFWRVGSSATLGSGSTFFGTVMANVSVTATTDADITGRLLARTGAVTLDTNVITDPGTCAAGTVSASPVITGTAAPTATVGTPYTSDVTATGTPLPTYAVTGGALPPGLVLDSTTGAITGTPTTPGTYTFEVTASNGVAPDAVSSQQIVVAAVLPATGTVPGPAVALGVGALALGAALIVRRRRSPAPAG